MWLAGKTIYRIASTSATGSRQRSNYDKYNVHYIVNVCICIDGVYTIYLECVKKEEKAYSDTHALKHTWCGRSRLYTVPFASYYIQIDGVRRSGDDVATLIT